MNKKHLPALLTLTLILSGCVIQLKPEGKNVRIVEDKAAHQCRFIEVVTGSGSWGASTAHDAEGAMNELRNRAAKVGGNAIKIVNLDSDIFTTAVVAEALDCNFED